jgi:hypothetical protein
MPFFVPAGSIVLPPLPQWPGGTVHVLPYSDVFNAVKRQAPLAQLEVSDASFLEVPEALLQPLIAWTQRAREALRFNYVAQSRDCDKFAKAFTLAFECCAAARGIQAQPLCARIYVRCTEPWAGVRDGTHALNAVATTGGIYVVEPQNGQCCPLAAYPNRTGIFKVTIGG